MFWSSMHACDHHKHSSSSSRPALTGRYTLPCHSNTLLLAYAPMFVFPPFPPPRSAPCSRTQSPVIRSPVGDIHVGLRSTVGFCNHCPRTACTSTCCFAWRSWSSFQASPPKVSRRELETVFHPSLVRAKSHGRLQSTKNFFVLLLRSLGCKVKLNFSFTSNGISNISTRVLQQFVIRAYFSSMACLAGV